MPAQQVTRWCFTVNNWCETDMDKLLGLDYTYMIIGSEVGESGTPHLQGFVIVRKRCSMSAMKAVHSTAHWEVARGTTQQASDYCKKDGEYEEYGTFPDAGAIGATSEQERWTLARAAAKTGKFDDIPADIFMRCYRTIKDIAKDHMVKPDDADGTTGVWIYGPPGVGKSRKARADYPGAYLKMQNKWWDGYQDEEHVILDDFDCKELGHLLKIWTDRYSFLAETKGGAIHIRPKTVVITSNYSIDDMDWKDDAMRDALKRRFKVIHMIDPVALGFRP